MTGPPAVWLVGALGLAIGSFLNVCIYRLPRGESVVGPPSRCPSCGRTLFDLEETTARVKAKTEHLKGVKIAIMGCVVNGPGEMADADFGYVGSGVEQVTLYVGKQIVARALPADTAPDRLVDLIREHGMWREPAD